jgi:hypothetical protein
VPALVISSRSRASVAEGQGFTLHTHPAVADRLQNEEKNYVSELETRLQIRLTIKANDGLRQGQFNVLPF